MVTYLGRVRDQGVDQNLNGQLVTYEASLSKDLLDLLSFAGSLQVTKLDISAEDSVSSDAAFGVTYLLLLGAHQVSR